MGGEKGDGSVVFFRPAAHHQPHSHTTQAAAVLYAKAGGAPSAYAASATSLLAGEAAGSTALLTFVLFWTLAHNWVHLF